MIFCAGLVSACSPDENAQVRSDTSQTTQESPVDTKAPYKRTTPRATGDEAFSSLPPPYNNADYSLGRRTFKFCGSCHTVRQGGQDLVGPNLHKIIGREAGTRASYSYSDVLGEADFVWTPAKLQDWLSNPRGFLPGNNMTFAGVHRPRDRTAVIAYLMLESGYEPGDLPE
ncbi:cytochrome c family protein [Henriciella sp.]|uniref:c-type cytochrome n=1 Tax=Henriciella sp. TaxID=1968823 RepID=UPI00345BB057